jgi:hypothetical protein
MMLIRDFRPGDLVWFDPGVGYVLPGEVVEFHKAAQVRRHLRDRGQCYDFSKIFAKKWRFSVQLGHKMTLAQVFKKNDNILPKSVIIHQN